MAGRQSPMLLDIFAPNLAYNYMRATMRTANLEAGDQEVPRGAALYEQSCVE